MQVTRQVKAVNIRLHYRYRDGGNYKQYGSVVFDNPGGLPLKEIEQRIRAALVDGEYFNARRWQLPDLRDGAWDDAVDPDWHEFASVEETDDLATVRPSIDMFLQAIARPDPPSPLSQNEIGSQGPRHHDVP